MTGIQGLKDTAEPGSKLTPHQRAKIHEAAVEFESMFVTEMMRPMMEMQEVDPYFGGGKGEETFRSMLVDEYGKKIGQNGGIGIAEHVEKELLRLQEVNHGKH